MTGVVSARIERVEPCSHDIAKGHRIAGEMLWCDGEDRKVLSGFPPEAVEAAAKAIHGKTLHRTVLSLEAEWDQLSSIVKADRRREAEAALAAAWQALTGEADK